MNYQAIPLSENEVPALELCRRRIANLILALEQEYPQAAPLLRDLIIAMMTDDFVYSHAASGRAAMLRR
jgi:hypothetical protein